MNKKNLLSVITTTLDFNFNVLSASKNKELVGRNLFDLFTNEDVALEERIKRMKQKAVIQIELLLTLEQKPKRYSVVIRKGYFQFIVVIIELEQMYQLMENVALFREYAFVDNLTGALTRHGYWNELFELLRYAEKHEDNVGVIFADIDNLKKMNTELGYNVGDAQISAVSRTIRKALRKGDMLVRLGGDEFLAVLPIRTNKEDSIRVISNRILKYVRENPQLKTTVSLGTQLLTPVMIAEILSKKDVKKAWEKQLEVNDNKVREAKLSGKNIAI